MCQVEVQFYGKIFYCGLANMDTTLFFQKITNNMCNFLRICTAKVTSPKLWEFEKKFKIKGMTGFV